jgi:serine/threonine-protein kinase
LDWFLQIMRKLAAGLHALHDAGYVHADMKPNNVILGKAGVVKIIDFGQSCPIGHRKERIQGTPDYIAPEQVRRMPLDRTTDVFNLGATMYWVLTDRSYPTRIRQTVRKGSIDIVGADEALTPKEINGRIPAALSQLVMDCCRENPAERPERPRRNAGVPDTPRPPPPVAVQPPTNHSHDRRSRRHRHLPPGHRA